MKNSLLLKSAVALCAANVVFALWSAWAMSNARSRLAAVENAIRASDQAMNTLRTGLATETKARESEAAGLRSEVKSIAQSLERLSKPPAGK